MQQNVYPKSSLQTAVHLDYKKKGKKRKKKNKQANKQTKTNLNILF